MQIKTVPITDLGPYTARVRNAKADNQRFEKLPSIIRAKIQNLYGKRYGAKIQFAVKTGAGRREPIIIGFGLYTVHRA
jgi:hypothetical protein